MKRYSRAFQIAFLIALFGYPVFLVLDVEPSRYVLIVITVLGLPASIMGHCYLRYNVVVTLLKTTYEVWFFTIINTITFTVAAMNIGDIRCLALVLPWLGLQVNILVDANTCAIRQIIWLTMVATIMILLAIPLVAMGWVHSLRDVILWEHNTHQLPSSTVVFNGVTTLVAMLVRNIVRYRAMLRRTRKMSDVNVNTTNAIVSCVAYRCILQYVSTSAMATTVAEDAPFNQLRSPPTGPRPAYMQRMRHQSVFGSIHAYATVVPLEILDHVDRRFNSRRLQWWALRLSVLSTLFAMPLDYYVRMRREERGFRETFPMFHVVSFATTTIFCIFSIAHYQRQLFHAILTSFEFWFVAVQVGVIHLALCDFFRWNWRTVALAFVSWNWNMWILCIDALTPRTRAMLGVNVHVVAHISGICIGSSVLVLYLMIFSETSTSIYDRVLFQKELLHVTFEFRVLPVFYSCFATILCSAVRFFWRVCTGGPNDLVVIDGPVVYDNYFRQGVKRGSIPWTQRGITDLHKGGEPDVHRQPQPTKPHQATGSANDEGT